MRHACSPISPAAQFEPTLTDWRGDPPRDRLVATAGSASPSDLPDRTAGVDYARRDDDSTADSDRRRGRDGGDGLTSTPPSWRPDLLQPADLVEEVLRLEGLEVIPSVLPQAPAGRGLTAVQHRRRAIGKSLALYGYVEILPTPFLPAGVFDAWGLPADDRRAHTTRVLNPLESDRPQLATTLLPGLLEALARNVSRGTVDVALFAIAQVVQPTVETRAVERIPIAPQAHRRRDRHTRRVAAAPAAARRRGPDGPARTGGPWGPGRPVEARDAFEAVRIIGRAGGVDFTLRAAQYLPWHPGRCAEVLVGETVVGHAGQLHPAVIERTGLPKGTCAVELTWTPSRSSRRCPRPRCRRFPRSFRTSA